MNARIDHLHNGTDHIVVVTLTAREVQRISNSLDENPDEWDKAGEEPTDLNRRFDELWQELQNGGYIEREFEREKSLPLDQCDPW
jgi:hypothetical protein